MQLAIRNSSSLTWSRETMHHHRSSTKEKASKRNDSKGRESCRASVKKLSTAAVSKQDRLNTLKQLRESKKEEILNKKRFGGDSDRLPPKARALSINGIMVYYVLLYMLWLTWIFHMGVPN